MCLRLHPGGGGVNASKLRTRRPTGKPPWPVLLVAGVEKAGKSYSAALFSASDLIDRTIIVELGEGAADQYGAIDGARYEIAIHDGTYASILEQIEGAVAEPRTNGKPHAIVIDNVTELWDMLSDEAQLKANQRAKAKAAGERKPAPVGEAQITMDLWNAAKKKWRRVIDALRVHDGPVILLARLESVAVMDGNAPAKNGAREWKVRAEKNLPFECDAIVKMTAPQECYLTGVRSVVLQVPPGEQLPLPGFTIDGLLRKMGLAAAGATAPRSYTAPQPVLDSDEEAAERQAQRERGQSEDEWSNAGPVMATPQQVEYLAKGLLAVRGAETPQARATAISQLLGRPFGDGEQLTQADAKTVHDKLVEEERQAAVLKRQEDTQAARDEARPEPATGAQLTLLNTLTSKRGITDRVERLKFLSGLVGGRPLTSSKDLTLAEASAIIDRLNVEEPSPDALSVREVLARRIRMAPTSSELADASEAVWKTAEAGEITQEQASGLIDLSMARETELAQPVGSAA